MYTVYILNFFNNFRPIQRHNVFHIFKAYVFMPVLSKKKSMIL